MTEAAAPTAAAEPAATEPPPSPYRGLRPYTEADAAFFFGREAEREIVSANLVGARLTLLYGPSGVGKSSVLLAGVASDLRERSRENLTATTRPASPWSSCAPGADPDPAEAIAAAARAEAAALLEREDLPDPPARATLAEVLDHWSAQVRRQAAHRVRPVRGVLPLPRRARAGPGTFDDEFPQAVNRADAASELPPLDPRRCARTARPLQGQDPEPVRQPAADRPPDARRRARRRDAADRGVQPPDPAPSSGSRSRTSS